MGDGFVVLQSSDIDIYYYQDEPGLCTLIIHITDTYIGANNGTRLLYVSVYD